MSSFQQQVLNCLARIESTLATMQSTESKMSDALDTITTDIAQVAADLTAEGMAIQSVLTVLQGLQSGAISVNDPRLAAAVAALQGVDSTVTAATTTLNAAVAPHTP